MIYDMKSAGLMMDFHIMGIIVLDFGEFKLFMKHHSPDAESTVVQALNQCCPMRGRHGASASFSLSVGVLTDRNEYDARTRRWRVDLTYCSSRATYILPRHRRVK